MRPPWAPPPLWGGGQGIGGGGGTLAPWPPPPPHLPWPPPLGINPRAPPPLSPPYIKRGRGRAATHVRASALPSLSHKHLRPSRGAWRSPAGILHHHLHHAVVLPVSPSTSPSPLLDQEGGDVPELYV